MKEAYDILVSEIPNAYITLSCDYIHHSSDEDEVSYSVYIAPPNMRSIIVEHCETAMEVVKTAID
jgi:PhoPQ-activated pathogenicity-related protein